MASRMYKDLSVLEGGEEFPAHVAGDDSVFQSKHMQRRDLEWGAVESLVFHTHAAETSNKNGKAEAELWFQSLLLKRTQHGHKGCSLTKTQDAVKRTLDRHGFPYSRHALIEAQALITLLLSAETPSLDVGKPPAPRVLVSSSSRD